MVSQKSVRQKCWATIVEEMNGHHNDVELTTEQCRQKWYNLQCLHSAWKLIVGRSGFGADSTDQEWSTVISLNRKCAFFRAEFVEPHFYNQMTEVIGNNCFDGSQMFDTTSVGKSSSSQQLEKAASDGESDDSEFVIMSEESDVEQKPISKKKCLVFVVCWFQVFHVCWS